VTYRVCKFHSLSAAVLVAVVVACLSLVLLASSQNGASGIRGVRAINTAEARFHQSSGRYGVLKELVSAGAFASGTDGTAINLNVEPESSVPGYLTHLIVAASGSSYSVMVSDATDPCHTVFFSDERGVIFHGQAFGCESPK
jgi:hypothetical protein